MLRLRLEVQPSAQLNEVCTQATRIATQLGIEVVFDYLVNDAVAKPGMNPESLMNEFLNEATAPVAKEPEAPAQTKQKETGKKGKQKDQAPVTAPEVTQPNVQEESI